MPPIFTIRSPISAGLKSIWSVDNSPKSHGISVWFKRARQTNPTSEYRWHKLPGCQSFLQGAFRQRRCWGQNSFNSHNIQFVNSIALDTVLIKIFAFFLAMNNFQYCFARNAYLLDQSYLPKSSIEQAQMAHQYCQYLESRCWRLWILLCQAVPWFCCNEDTFVLTHQNQRFLERKIWKQMK